MNIILPLLGLVLGLVVIVYGLLAYTGSAMLASLPGPLQGRKGDLLWLGGWVLLGLALALGMVGYVIVSDLRVVRILLGIVGVLLLVLAWPKNTPSVPPPPPPAPPAPPPSESP